MRTLNPKRAVPVLLFVFLFALIIDNGFKFMSLPISEDLGLDVTTVSLQATIPGILIGIGAVVYAALADSLSFRKLLNVGIALIAIGSLIGFFGQDSFAWVLAGRIIQTSGLAAAETLYVIYVTKFLSEKDQKTYLGFSTSMFQLGMLFGTLTSGFIATYVSWTAMFLVSLIAVAAIPFIHKLVPETIQVKNHLDIFGLLLIAVIATSVMMFMQNFTVFWLIPLILGIGFFTWHVRSHDKALVRPEFFTNGRYVSVLLVVLIVYSTQLALTFLFPFVLSELHNWSLDQASLLFAPGYAVGAIVGALSGVYAKALSTRATVILGLVQVIVAFILGAVFIDSSAWILAASIILLSSGFATMYAPLVNTALRDIPAEKSGIAIGFYNLTINIAIPVGIAYVAALMELFPADAAGSAAVLWVVAAIAGIGAVVYVVSDSVLTKKEARRSSAPRVR